MTFSLLPANLLRAFILAGLLVSLAGPTYGADDPSKSAEKDNTSSERVRLEPDKARPVPSSPRRFTPTEEISADGTVSFPVDI